MCCKRSSRSRSTKAPIRPTNPGGRPAVQNLIQPPPNNPTAATQTLITQPQANQATPPSILFSLPPELRVRIYNYVLLDHEYLPITNQLTEPPLLTASRLIRLEALQIFYLKNNFTITIHDCDASLLLAFSNHVAALCPGKALQIADIQLEDELYWSNLMAWCEAVFKKLCVRMYPKQEISDYFAVVAGALELASGMRGKMEWEGCRRALGSLRGVAAGVDEEWLEDD